ncbi:ABC transporter ATP-binding protein [Corynebacterium diphtheriae]|nr:ABC transporter ATP-binding protein [Corynebacterium diphtheriae]CAB0930745.1 ABC transporter ATP-binding protein [Corynebacterium diphtheriae]CAB0972572.1 ABC transporter ATP-binding protein [Corynebacterium diphtheriae]CAB0972857.1 ABC transporter ATP-binding protein [Corynebacterium diphtheriae]
MPTISFQDVTVRFDDKCILNNISLTLSEQRIGIIGANGSGKSSLVRLINGLGQPSSGTVTVDDMCVAKDGKNIRRVVGFVFSDAENQIVMPTVKDDIAFSLRRLKLSKTKREQRVNDMLVRFNLEDHAEQSPHLLSGGQKQLLALAAVLVIQPNVIIADEPTTLLDMRNRERIRKEFAQLQQQLIVVTHDLDFLADFDRVICINDGAIVADGTPSKVIHHYKALMKANPL